MNEKIGALLVEKDPQVAQLVMLLLHEPGWPSVDFSLTRVEDVRAALRALSERKELEAVLLDLAPAPGRGGGNALESLLRLRAHAPDVPIVVLVEPDAEALGLEAVRLGAQDYQVKGSLNAHHLKRTLTSAVERHHLLSSLETLLDKASDAMVVVDAQGVVRYLNPATETLLGQPRKQLLGKAFPYPVARGAAGELTLTSPDGTAKTADLRAAEIVWKDEPALLATLRDVTVQRRLDQLKTQIQERQRVDQAKDDLMNAVSHQMRTPLTVIGAAVSSLREGLAGPVNDKQAELLGMAQANSQRLLKIINNLLELAWLESGKTPIQRRRLEAPGLVAETLPGLRLLAERSKISVEEDVPADLPPVYACPDLFAQILTNLVSNAVRFAKSRVTVRARTADPEPGGAARRVQFSVIDDGPGVPAERIPDLFNKFVQIHRQRGSDGYKGTGLGLAICAEMVRRLGGKIWAESPRGQGARFHFTLPQYERAAVAPAEKTERPRKTARA